ncbi:MULTISPECIES: thymidine kinase [unclassified Oceanispirochaeta]|uniref:thymidine kinase n=1 Tax=unclassified Oceanispirochaeta TaxID=2635722 RepID=UPI000E08F7D3|nr:MULTISPECIES: thymidine kinase [unclassified Oceanispirochaeta]MBF9016054.1 thymidine kinase [Oceanispirochaeta sp. M2]NPD72517.1 thymidine kinase [Oceanispirochaeta sp. M1]RDG31975.1 thymidine kinase [Oceanispirochaeta sp. M1]
MGQKMERESGDFLKSLGFPEIRVHQSYGHFDFTKPCRRILVIGPMGSGKTEYSAKIWRDARVTLEKSDRVGDLTRAGDADRRNVFFVRSALDEKRFEDYPDDALAYRGGYERLGNNIAKIRNSFDLEKLIDDFPEMGTWIIDEASFFDERMAYVIKNASEKKDLVFVYPTLILNFRRDIFNSTARLLIETATDVYPLTAYCEHSDCILDSFYTYRYYSVGGKECPALYFDPLIIIGGDLKKEDPREPNYCTRCDNHHFLPGKVYTYFTLKPLGETAAGGNSEPLKKELILLSENIKESLLYASVLDEQEDGLSHSQVIMNSLKVPCIAEKALLYLYVEQNLVSTDLFTQLADELKLDREYLISRLADNGRTIRW